MRDALGLDGMRYRTVLALAVLCNNYFRNTQTSHCPGHCGRDMGPQGPIISGV